MAFCSVEQACSSIVLLTVESNWIGCVLNETNSIRVSIIIGILTFRIAFSQKTRVVSLIVGFLLRIVIFFVVVSKIESVIANLFL